MHTHKHSTHTSRGQHEGRCLSGSLFETQHAIFFKIQYMMALLTSQQIVSQTTQVKFYIIMCRTVMAYLINRLD